MAQVIHSRSIRVNTRAEANSKAVSALLAPFGIVTLIFFLTTVVGVWAAPDRSAAFSRLALFLVGLLLLAGVAWSGRRNAETGLGLVGLFCGVLAGGLTIYFLLTTNWTDDGPSRLRVVNELGLWLHSHVRDLSHLPGLHKNLTGGAITILLPLSLIGTVWAWIKRYPVALLFSVICWLVALLGLLVSVSRGAWLGVAFGTAYGAYLYWRTGPGTRSKFRWIGDIFIAGSIFLIFYGFWLVSTNPNYGEQFSFILGDSAVSRPNLWQDSLTLIQDYPFTGSGLGSTTMVYSTYVFLLHVPFLAHAHNLFLQIAIEQGLPGLISFAILAVYSVWALTRACRHGSQQLRLYATLTIASVAGMLIHGTLDAELYIHPLVPIIFLPFGVALATDRPAAESVRMQRVANFASLAPTVLILLLFLWPGSIADLRANLGAVAQTRAELAVYNWPEWPIQDELRRQKAVDLSEAIGHYNRALATDPNNVTALRRLGQIEISLGDYEVARRHLEAAYSIAPGQRATRQMLGELYAIDGEIDRALKIWQPLNLGHGQLQARLWWHAHIGSEKETQRLKQAITQFQEIEE